MLWLTFCRMSEGQSPSRSRVALTSLMNIFVLVSIVLFLKAGNGGSFGAPKKLPQDEVTMESYAALLAKVAGKINDHYGLQNLHIITKLLNATSQVVQGIKYTFFVELSPTSCTNFDQETYASVDTAIFQQNSCGIVSGEVCKATVWERPWLPSNESEIIDIVHCSSNSEQI
ncbi:unnamed protein product [Heterobilharzia americana]|nr:unnamed protein product [Heterobilharzia americana]CAH8512688.1 unnamed protein product [Heterobilharzia americana]